jgi:hypothetical protein
MNLTAPCRVMAKVAALFSHLIDHCVPNGLHLVPGEAVGDLDPLRAEAPRPRRDRPYPQRIKFHFIVWGGSGGSTFQSLIFKALDGPPRPATRPLELVLYEPPVLQGGDPFLDPDAAQQGAVLGVDELEPPFLTSGGQIGDDVLPLTCGVLLSIELLYEVAYRRPRGGRPRALTS